MTQDMTQDISTRRLSGFLLWIRRRLLGFDHVILHRRAGRGGRGRRAAGGDVIAGGFGGVCDVRHGRTWEGMTWDEKSWILRNFRGFFGDFF